MAASVSSTGSDPLPSPEQLAPHTQTWKEIYNLIKHSPKYNKQRDERQMLSVIKAILYKEKQGCTWNRIPSEYGDPGRTYYYYKLWQREGVLDNMLMLAKQINTPLIMLQSAPRIK